MENRRVYVKGSGTELATIKADGFVKADMKKLDKIWSRTYSKDRDTREEQVLEDLMASRYPGEGAKRPSVEILLHALLPYRYVVHTHPAIVNGLTCSVKGEEVIKDVFGDTALWIPVINPGYVLSKDVKDRIDIHLKSGKAFPSMIFLQNHGIFIYGDTIKEIDETYDSLFSQIKKRITKKPVNDVNIVPLAEAVKVEEIIKKCITNIEVISFNNSDILSFSETKESFKPLELSLTPDHIVYYGHKPIFVEKVEDLENAIVEYIKENGVNPRLVVVSKLGAFAFNSTISLAEKAKMLFLDDVKVAVYCKSFGGVQFMPQDQIDFIRNWEVEKYRFSQSN